jgi:hypothetical protein
LHFLSIFALLNLRACALVVAGYIVFHLFFLLSAAFLSFLRAAGPRLRRVSLCFGLLTTAAISCFGLVKVSKKKNEAQPVTRHAASCADTFCPAPPPVRLGLVVCPVGYIKKEKSKKKESKKKENKKKKKRNPNGHAQACCVVCTAVFQWPCFFLVGVFVAYYQKKSRGSCDRFC